MNRKRIVLGSLLLGLLAALIALPGIQLAGGAVERLQNGDFESGFQATPAGSVGDGWHWFHNGGEATYGFYDETWAPVIHAGDHAQLIEINTYGRAASDADRYAGIYQTVAVVAGERYELNIYGMLRALADDPDRSNYSYRVQYGVDYDGGTDWQAVDEWVELPWDTVHPRLSPGEVESYTATLTATGPRLTLFVRAWKKWGTAGRELDVNLDSISLKGAMPAEGGFNFAEYQLPSYPVAGWPQTLSIHLGSDAGITHLILYDNGQVVAERAYDIGMLRLDVDIEWTPADAGTHHLELVADDASNHGIVRTWTLVVGQAAEFLVNGDFEGGFHAVPKGVAGTGWGAFDNGGAAEYGFYDETWPPVIYEGDHAQLIEINTYKRAATDADRYAGIYQTVVGLTPGATYHLSLHGMLRAVGGEGGDYNYRLEWGYAPLAGTDWSQVDNWVEIPWDEVYPRLSPGSMDEYETTFVAPSEQLTLFFRGWKKWAITEQEFDLNLDAISLTGYSEP
ncbi:MAG: hypothetical protein PVJ34_20895 [Anaerolineae bacterium]|jgi:hypothetical protein